jgi:hypothetical protein
VDVERAFAHIVQEPGDPELHGRLETVLAGDSVDVVHGLDGMSAVARAHREEEVQFRG